MSPLQCLYSSFFSEVQRNVLLSNQVSLTLVQQCATEIKECANFFFKKWRGKCLYLVECLIKFNKFLCCQCMAHHHFIRLLAVTVINVKNTLMLKHEHSCGANVTSKASLLSIKIDNLLQYVWHIIGNLKRMCVETWCANLSSLFVYIDSLMRMCHSLHSNVK